MKNQTVLLDTSMKKCKECGELKPLSSYHKQKTMKDGHLNKCGSCVYEYTKKWREANPSSRKKEYKKWAKKNNVTPMEEVKANNAKTFHKRAKASRRKAHVKRRASLQNYKMTAFDEFVFEEASELTDLRKESTGFNWHVDHIVPLQHKEACGLNSAVNFQVVPALWNITKGNRNMNTFLGKSA